MVMSTIVVYDQNNPMIGSIKESLKRTNVHRQEVGVRVCQDKIGDQFVSEAIDSAHIIVVNYSNSNIIGFAAVTRHDDETGQYLYIDLICNEPHPTITTRSMSAAAARKGAKAMLEQIENVARDNGCSHVKLSAIDSVIPYYYRFGYDFERVFLTKGDINNHLKTKEENLVRQLRNAQIDEDTEVQDKLLIQIVHIFYTGFFNEKYQASVADSTSAADRIQPAETNGIPMIKIINPSAGAAAHGGKKHKKKTIRKKYTKKGMLKKSKKYRRRRV